MESGLLNQLTNGVDHAPIRSKEGVCFSYGHGGDSMRVEICRYGVEMLLCIQDRVCACLW